MKKLKLVSVLTAFVIAVSGCGKEDEAVKSDLFLVVCSFYPVYIIALNVADGIEGVRVTNMIPPVTGCLHDYSATAADMKNLENAGIFLFSGAGMESFIDKIAGKYPLLKTAELSSGITLIKNVSGGNPHVWVSVSNAIAMTRNCAAALSGADKKHADQYQKNAAKYIRELTELKSGMKAGLEKFSGKKIITFHEAFPYFAEEFNLEIAAVIEREPGSEPSAKELADTINLIRRTGIKSIFAEPQYPAASAGVIARETGAQVFTLDPAVAGENDKGAYIKIMKSNLSVLAGALSEK